MPRTGEKVRHLVEMAVVAAAWEEREVGPAEFQCLGAGFKCLIDIQERGTTEVPKRSCQGFFSE